MWQAVCVGGIRDDALFTAGPWCRERKTTREGEEGEREDIMPF